MKEFIIAIDQGTTSSRAICFNKQGEIIGVAQKSSLKFIPNLDGLNIHLKKY